MQELDGYGAAKQRVISFVHHASPALSDDVLQAVSIVITGKLVLTLYL